MFRKLLLAGVLLLGSMGVIGGLALTTTTTAGAANSVPCKVWAQTVPMKGPYGVVGEAWCGAPAPPSTYVLMETCVQIDTVYGWLNAPAPGNPNWNTDCDNADTYGYQVSVSTCLAGTFNYRTLTVVNFTNKFSSTWQNSC